MSSHGRRRHKKTGQIDWPKLEHVKVTTNEDSTKLVLQLRPVDIPLPKVTIITELTNIVLFQFSMYSWGSLLYPPHLLNWIIIDNEKRLDTSLYQNDKRVRVITVKENYNDLIKKVMEIDWINSGTELAHKDGREDAPREDAPREDALKEDALKEDALNRKHVYTYLACGDILYSDSLALKHRAMTIFKKDCVCPDSLAFYNPHGNMSVVCKLFNEYPKSGLYWRKSWWNVKSSSKTVGIPYIGNCVTIGNPIGMGVPQISSIRFFDAFSDPLKKIIRSMLQAWVDVNRRLETEDVDVETDDRDD